MNDSLAPRSTASARFSIGAAALATLLAAHLCVPVAQAAQPSGDDLVDHRPANERLVQRSSRRGGLTRLPDLSMLLMSLPDVQEELDVSKEQGRVIRALQADLLSQAKQRRGREFRQHRAISRQLWRVVLGQKQAVRLAQLRVQYMGVPALADTELAAELALTQEQRREIRELQVSSDAQTREDLADILEEEQYKTWLRRSGESFSFSEDALRFRRFLRRAARRQ